MEKENNKVAYQKYLTAEKNSGGSHSHKHSHEPERFECFNDVFVCRLKGEKYEDDAIIFIQFPPSVGDSFAHQTRKANSKLYFSIYSSCDLIWNHTKTKSKCIFIDLN